LHELHVVPDGMEAMSFLHREPPYDDALQPDVILLDLNLPRMDVREVLAAIKGDPGLTRIPVVILTTSHAEEDILMSYDLYANGYIVKPVELDQFFAIIKNIKEFWMSLAVLAPKDPS